MTPQAATPTGQTCDGAAVSDDEELDQRLRQFARVQHQAIERRAYQLFLERGGAHGHDLNDWLEAERTADRSQCS